MEGGRVGDLMEMIEEREGAGDVGEDLPGYSVTAYVPIG